MRTPALGADSPVLGRSLKSTFYISIDLTSLTPVWHPKQYFRFYLVGCQICGGV